MACSASESQNKFFKGFNDLKNANNLLRRHEESNSHQQHFIELLMSKKKRWLRGFLASEPNRRRTKVLGCFFRANNRGCQVFS